MEFDNPLSNPRFCETHASDFNFPIEGILNPTGTTPANFFSPEHGNDVSPLYMELETRGTKTDSVSVLGSVEGIAPDYNHGEDGRTTQTPQEMMQRTSRHNFSSSSDISSRIASSQKVKFNHNFRPAEFKTIVSVVSEDSPTGNDIAVKEPDRRIREKRKSGRKWIRWSREEDQTLRNAVRIEGQPPNWKMISKTYFNGQRTDIQCKNRWKKVSRQ